MRFCYQSLFSSVQLSLVTLQSCTLISGPIRSWKSWSDDQGTHGPNGIGGSSRTELRAKHSLGTRPRPGRVAERWKRQRAVERQVVVDDDDVDDGDVHDA